MDTSHDKSNDKEVKKMVCRHWENMTLNHTPEGTCQVQSGINMNSHI